MVESANAIIPATLNARAVAELALSMSLSIMEIRRTVLHEGFDYGKIPGTNKDVLLKPGAEKLSSAFKLYPVPKLLTCVEDWKDGFFFYRYQIDMMHRETGEIWGSGIGSCNSREKKYNWRWVTESELPAGTDKDTLLKEDGMQTLTEFDFAVKEAKTSGQYAKTAEYWQVFKDAIANGKAKKIQKELKNGTKKDAWEVTSGVARYRIPNPEICDLVNTIDKMAYKRALVAAVLIATNASEFFTQDMEDFMSLALPDEDNVIEGQVEDVTPPPAVPAATIDRTTPAPSILLHWSKDAVKMNWLIGDCVDKGFLEPGQTEKDLLELIEREDFLDFPTCKEHAVPAIAAHVKARYDLAELTRQPAPPARPMRYQHNVTEATFDTRTEDITFMVPAEPTKKELFKPLVVKRSFFLAKLTHGETNDRLNGEAQAEAMGLDKWNTSSPLASSHSFPEVQLDYDALINGTARLTLMAARPTTNWLNKPKSETLANGGENDDIPATAVSPHYRKRAAQPMAGGG